MLVIDSENTTYNKGNPFDSRNKNVLFSCYDGTAFIVRGEYSRLQKAINDADIVVGFNLKYDLHWLRKCGISLPERVWDCQVAEFVLEKQSTPYPSLDSVAGKYGVGKKITTIEEEYWSKGIDTDQIPPDILAEYAIQDVLLTHKVYLKQQELIPAEQKTLLNLLMQDLLVLQEMEWNGLYFDKEEARKKAQELRKRKSEIQAKLDLYHSVPGFNWSSGHHLSALLYGGVIKTVEKVPDGEYKTGAKKGQIKYKRKEVEYTLPRKYKPLRRSELKKEGLYATDEVTLQKLGKSELLDGIAEMKKIDKLIGTYYEGLQELHSEMNFEPNIIHGQFNQCVARTGRLSSSRPNLQNISDEAGGIFGSRFK